ncbi:MAG: hypothetical protein AM1032_000034 [Mycoplasmataceae bacterium]|nr:MAG: hypothetical protein AM1032_000034 [Mycoplasmataceae bacterium]
MTISMSNFDNNENNQWGCNNNLRVDVYLDKWYPIDGTCLLKDNKNYKKSCKEITELNLSNLKLFGFLKLSRFENLEDLDFSYNQITELHLNNNFKLRKLNCSFNNLQTLHLNENQSLMEIDASDNEIYDFNFQGNNTSSLKKINIANNDIEETDVEVFKSFINLELLWIGTWNKENIIKSIYNRFHGSFKSFENLEKLESLFVSCTDINGGIEYLPISLSCKNSKISWYLHFKNQALLTERKVNDAGEELNKIKDNFGSLIKDKIRENQVLINSLNKSKISDENTEFIWSLLVRENYLKTKLSLLRGLEIPNPIRKENSEYSKDLLSTNLIGAWKGKEVTLKKLKVFKEKEFDFFELKKIIWRLTSLRHNNISKYLESFRFEKEENLYIALEYNNEKKLSDLISLNENFQYNCFFLKLIFNIIEGLSYLHGNNIEHGNLNLNNIIVNERFEAKLKDFSLMKFSNLLKEKLNKKEEFSSLLWLAPEMVKISENDSELEILGQDFFQPKRDIYSLGMIMKSIAFQELDPLIFNDDNLWISKKVVEIIPNIDDNQELFEIIRDCSEKEQEKRISLSELLYDLEFSSCMFDYDEEYEMSDVDLTEIIEVFEDNLFMIVN